jgi:hypothetical protein
MIPLKNQKISVALKLIISLLFVTSAISKLFPIWAFESQLMTLGLGNLNMAQYAARFIIGLELSIGLCYLQKNQIKRIIIPTTVGLLIIFCIHLIFQMIQSGGMVGNCGCFGELIPMTPLEALIKNILTIFILFILHKKIPVENNINGQGPIIILLISMLLVFLLFPIYLKTKTTPPIVIRDTIFIENAQIHRPVINTLDEGSKIPGKNPNVPKTHISVFHNYNTFLGTTGPIDLDNGKHIICLMNANCDHCKEVAVELNRLYQTKKIPPICIFFLDEETEEIPVFFKTIGTTYPYKILSLEEFRDLTNMSFPSVFYMWNGNEIISFKGTGNDKFISKKLLDKLN